MNYHTEPCATRGCVATATMPTVVVDKYRKTGETFYCYLGHGMHFTPLAEDVMRLQKAEAELKRLQNVEAELKAAREQAAVASVAVQATKRANTKLMAKAKAEKERADALQAKLDKMTPERAPDGKFLGKSSKEIVKDVVEKEVKR